MSDEMNGKQSAHAHAQNLISRVIDGDVSEEQWHEFEALAQANPLLWRELAETQRDHASLTMVVSHAGAVAERVAAPTQAFDESVDAHGRVGSRISAWSGWAVAALVAIVALPRVASMDPGPASGETTRAGLLQSLTPAESYQHYLEKGREAGHVVGEMPAMVMVETRPAPSGQGFEVLYLRQVLERTVVPDLYQVHGQTEDGQPTLIRFEPRARSSM